MNTSGRYGEINLSDEATKKQWDEGIKMLISNLNVVKDSGPICTASIVLERKLTSDSTKLFDISLHWHDDPPGKCYCKVSVRMKNFTSSLSLFYFGNS